jgi:hypothetical protein
LGTAPFLLIDERGACIFHSQEFAWKRQNDFMSKFFQLVQLLDKHDAERYYDFTEFVFLGTDRVPKKDAEEYVLRIEDAIFEKQAYFTGASFLDSFELERVDFRDGASFDQAAFNRELRFENTRSRSLDFTGARFGDGVSFKEVGCLNFAFFSNANFDARRDSALVHFKSSFFEGITDFSDANFTLGDQSAVRFENVQFQDVVVFRNTHFNCQVDFSDVTFSDKTEFIDTSFEMVRSTARYRGTAVEFNRITVTAEASLSFISTDPQRKMFNHDVEMSFKSDPSGFVRFENVNFQLFTADTKDRLTRLARLGHVAIGSGCIKYRLQTDIHKVAVSEGNVAIVLDLCQMFVNYFTESNGLNLGIEIVERNKLSVSFFYFSDEDISEDTFRERLTKTKQSLWGLLSIDSEEQLSALYRSTETSLSTGKESAVINAVDAISTLLGTFFRVGTRIALGRWSEADTSALLNAIPLNQEGARARAAGLHRLLIDRYTRDRLLDLSGQLNHELFLQGKVDALDQTVKLLADKGNTYVVGDKYEITGTRIGTLAAGSHAHLNRITSNQIINQKGQELWEKHMNEKIKILFLAANPTDTSALRLGEEVRQIEEKIALGSHRDAFELIQQHAVRVTDLQRILLKYQPHIVHFSGHGSETNEIVLEDNQGKSKAVSRESLSTLFRILKDNVRVVVLNACFSKIQAAALDETIDYVVGMNKEVGDKMAISFAGAFYQALAFDRTVTEAFELAKNELDLVRLSGADIPELFVRAGADVKRSVIVREDSNN